jgi:hypothetical protein
MKIRIGISGLNHYCFDEVKDLIFPGTPVSLEFEPENPHDDTAVRVMVLGQPIGYVNEGQTQELPVLQGKPFKIHSMDNWSLDIEEI